MSTLVAGVPKVFVERATGVAHEVFATSDYVDHGIVPRCHVNERISTGNLLSAGDCTEGPVTCIKCVGTVLREWIQTCIYCGTGTGVTYYQWATDDICSRCLADRGLGGP